MQHVEKVIEVNRPVSDVYDQWTQFEEFPSFMTGITEVRRFDERYVHWRADIWGKEKQWFAEITEQQPGRLISWKSVSGAPNAGTIRFKPLGPYRTRVRVVMAYEPDGVIERLGESLGLMSARVQSTVEDFRDFIETRRPLSRGDAPL